MGMASLVITSDGKGHIEKLDWQPLLPLTKGATIGKIVEATGRYIDSITTPDPSSPFVASSSTRLVPNIIVIEQQHVSVVTGINLHALEIQAALLARFAERFPTTEVRSVGASARKSKGLGFDTKERATAVGFNLVTMDGPYWTTYAFGLAEQQHTYDAATMALDCIDFRGFDALRIRMQEWAVAKAAAAPASADAKKTPKRRPTRGKKALAV
ncbi:MAG: hypothetical protein WC483_00140 [Candidatus Paceibacterota bacterium]